MAHSSGHSDGWPPKDSQGDDLQSDEDRDLRKGQAAPEKGPRNARSLGHILADVVAPLCHKNPHMRLMWDWPLIVGQSIAAYTWPHRMLRPGGGDGVLYVQVRPLYEMQAWADSPLIIERVNQHMGYPAVTRIRFLPARIPQGI